MPNLHIVEFILIVGIIGAAIGAGCVGCIMVVDEHVDVNVEFK